MGKSEADQKLYELLFEGRFDWGQQPSFALNQQGEATAPIIGGNVSLLAGSLGTSCEIDTDRKILFIEEVGEALYHFDRLMTQLMRAGKLHRLAGLVVGGLTNMNNPGDKFALSAEEIICDKVKRYDYPVAFQAPIGHQAKNFAIQCGALYHLSVQKDGWTLNLSESAS